MRNKNSSNCPEKAKIGGIELKVCMAKVRNFAEITPNLPFTCPSERLYKILNINYL